MKKVVEVKGLVKRYKELTAIDHLDLDVEEGEILGLLGPNGSGKTTTMNCILSLLKFDEGEISIFGEKMTPESYNSKRQIGVVFQNVALFEDLTVYENVDYFCSLYVTDKETRKTLVEEAIDMVGLQEFVKFFPKKLSGGLLRRLNIACGIAHKPKLIFLDEPTVAVDPQSRNNILESIKNLNKAGATIIYTSHYMEEVEQLCNRIVIMDKGKAVAVGTKEKLKRMVEIGEKISLEVSKLKDKHLKEIEQFDDVKFVTYEEDILYVQFTSQGNHLVSLLEYMKEQKLSCRKIVSELPTLNDVFLEITGKQLRD